MGSENLYSEFYEDKKGEIIFVTFLVPEERENLIKMYEEFDPERRCCGLPPQTRRGIEAWINGLYKNGYNFIAKHGDKVIAHIAAVPVGNEAEFAIFVHQAYEDRGIGGELIRFAEKFLREKGVKKIKALTERINRRAVEAYMKLGFSITERDPEYLVFEKVL